VDHQAVLQSSNGTAAGSDEIKPGELADALPAAAALMLKLVPGQKGDCNCLTYSHSRHSKAGKGQATPSPAWRLP
jgi:hypothetical protein